MDRPLRTGLRDLRSPVDGAQRRADHAGHASAAMPDAWTVNGAEYAVLRLLGKGKGGYSYLVTDGASQYVLKQIHHEPCEYYTFGDKLQSELRDYETLRKLGIPMPRLLAADIPQERILKEYIAGPTVAELLQSGTAGARLACAGARHVPPAVPGRTEYRLLSHQLRPARRSALLH